MGLVRYDEEVGKSRMPTFRELGLDMHELPSGPECVTPMVEGLPTYAYAETHKNDLRVMLLCCDAEENANGQTGQFPAPFFFDRAAILANKDGDKALELQVCTRFAKSVQRSRVVMKSTGAKIADVSVGPKGRALLQRLKKLKGEPR